VGYTLHTDFGAPEDLVEARRLLNEHSIRLILDFVPNHYGLDHPWIEEHPEYFIPGTEEDLKSNANRWVKLGDKILAYGRDPYYDGWPDTVQLNYRHSGFREAQKNILINLTSVCDGLRCDMAMLLLPDVIHRTWGDLSNPNDGSQPVDESFWLDVIPAVKKNHNSFTWIGEVYWDLEWELQQQGFNYTYDKRLYDRLVQKAPEPVRLHLHADLSFMERSVRFLENHDEPRAASEFPDEGQHKAAAIVTFCVPGMHFFAEGEAEGFKSKVSMHVGRRRPEEVNTSIFNFYKLLHTLRNQIKNSDFKICPVVKAWGGNGTWNYYIAWTMISPEDKILFVVNYGGTQGQCLVQFDHLLQNMSQADLEFTDISAKGEAYSRKKEDIQGKGMFIDLASYSYHIFRITENEIK